MLLPRHFRVVAFFFLASFACGQTHAEEPLVDFSRHAQFNDIKISPDGDYLAASAIVDGKTVLSLIHLADMKGVNLRPRDSRELAGFWWVAPTRVMYTVGERFGALEQPSSTGELFAVNADGTGDGNLYGYRAGPQGATHIAHATSKVAFAQLIDPLRDDPKHALIATYPVNGAWIRGMRASSSTGVFPQVERIDLTSGVTSPVTISPLRQAEFLTDNQGVVRFAYGADEEEVAKVWYRAGEGKEWELVLDGAKDHHRAFPLAFDRKQDKVYMSCDNGKGPGGLCTWDVATRKLTRIWNGAPAEVSSLVRSFDHKDVIALRSMPGRTATTLIEKDAPEAKLLVGLMQQFPGEDVRITSSTPDGSKVVFLVESGRNPGEFFLYDGKTRKASFLFARRPWIKPDAMAAVAPIALKSRDGLDLHGYLTRPPEKASAKNLPLVVYVHGGPYGVRDEWAFDPQVQALASRGYAVLQINYRGSGDYGYGFERAGFREWGGKMQNDVTDATRWAIAQGIADPKRVCIFGGSYGGYAALEGAEREPDLYRCAIGYVGVYDLRLMYTRGDIPQSTFGDNYLKMVLGQDDATLWDRSPVAHVDRLKAKVMLVVGGEDWRVPPVQGEAMHAALNKAHIEHEWLYQRTEGHGFYDEKHRLDLYEKVTAFLDRNLGVGAR